MDADHQVTCLAELVDGIRVTMMMMEEGLDQQMPLLPSSNNPALVGIRSLLS